MSSEASEKKVKEYLKVEIGETSEEISLSNAGSSADESIKLIDKQQEHYDLMIEHIALEKAAFETS